MLHIMTCSAQNLVSHLLPSNFASSVNAKIIVHRDHIWEHAWKGPVAPWLRTSELEREVIPRGVRPTVPVAISAGTCYTCKLSVIPQPPPPVLLNENLCSWDNAICVLTSCLGHSDVHWSLGSIIQQELFPSMHLMGGSGHGTGSL